MLWSCAALNEEGTREGLRMEKVKYFSPRTDSMKYCKIREQEIRGLEMARNAAHDPPPPPRSAYAKYTNLGIKYVKYVYKKPTRTWYVLSSCPHSMNWCSYKVTLAKDECTGY